VLFVEHAVTGRQRVREPAVTHEPMPTSATLAAQDAQRTKDQMNNVSAGPCVAAGPCH
jgi:hypothetical protein